MTASELRDAQARYERAARHAEEARAARTDVVVRALREGWTHAQIAEATGLTRGRIGQFACIGGRAWR